jgi:hypothetical protein
VMPQATLGPSDPSDPRPARSTREAGRGETRATRRELLRAGMDALVESGGKVRVSGGCMVPAVPVGARVRLVPCSAGGLHPGDVVLLERKGVFFLHRYLVQTGTGGQRRLVVKSDRGRRADAPWPPASVVGRLVEVVEGAGGDGVDDGESARAYRPGRATRLRAAAEGLFWAHAFPFLREVRNALLGRRRGR